jgi:nucleoid-associated protein YgaU
MGLMSRRSAGPAGSRRSALVALAWAPVLCVVGWLVARLTAEVWRTATWATVVGAAPRPTFADGVMALALAVLGVALAWLSLTVTVCLVAEAVGSCSGLAERAAAALAPRTVRLLVKAVCGVAVAAPLGAVPAGAAELPLPDRPDVTTQTPQMTQVTQVTQTASQTLHRPTTSATVVVRPGDSLWSIAADHLPPDAPAATIATAWPQWYTANRERIGHDPHLIHPGTRLLLPPDPAARPGRRSRSTVQPLTATEEPR